MENSPLYKNIFSRDFTLAVLEIWWRAETIDDKIWTEEMQPFLPYIIFERLGRTVNGFYDPRGIEWIKKLLVKNAKTDKNFIGTIEKNYGKRAQIKNLIVNKKYLSPAELGRLFKNLEEAWVWLEAGWWLWEMTPEETAGIIIPESLKRLREETQDLVPNIEIVIRSSFERAYPEIAEYADVIRIREMISGDIPDLRELSQRKTGYFFADDQLFVGLTRSEIEKKFSMRFETLSFDKNLKEFNGQSTYAGRVNGRVKIVLGTDDFDKVAEGDILISTMTLPNFLPAMKRSAAIVTDEGGLLCHAAIVTRELKKPCIIGTKIATKVLKDGDMVEVDADDGVVKILKHG